MNQEKIGKFIAACRKEQNLTQAKLAERLGITDRAISKWETGRCMPDSSIMLELCELLDISVNELFTGERIVMKDYDKFAEENLLSMRKQEEESNKMFLRLENVVGLGASITFLLLVLEGCFATESILWRSVLFTAGIITFSCGIWVASYLERESGYYKCTKCGHIYVPDAASLSFTMYFGRTRFMKCPKCGQKSCRERF